MTVLSPVVPAYTGEPGSTISWPTTREFQPARMQWGVSTSRTAWAAPYTGQTQRVSHLADRLRVTVELPLVARDLAGRREAYFMAASAAGKDGRMVLGGHSRCHVGCRLAAWARSARSARSAGSPEGTAAILTRRPHP